ncbi:hypothetical protein OG723_40380 [Streptomyces sp. NBC_01278]|uniref:hypothetical protein n=1 Tax=Streptomyces sp. NBC_01278 TaxID=2903809 RepID=UPI002E326556|nr:hypothetical protein [Streptomyces sp. NBC_01278]
MTAYGLIDPFETQEDEEHDAKVIPFPLRTFDPPLVHSPDVLYSTPLDLHVPAAAGSRP